MRRRSQARRLQANSTAHTSDSGSSATPDAPSSAPPAGLEARSDSDGGYSSEALGSSRPGPKPGGYDSRVEAILYENPALPILITDAGKGADGTKHIVYTIRTGVSYDVLSLRGERALS